MNLCIEFPVSSLADKIHSGYELDLWVSKKWTANNIALPYIRRQLYFSRSTVSGKL